MKFKKLTLHNLASIEDATLDFEAQPLAGSEVFLITGRTGSGKSTLLDAICLALYGLTPRLANNEMQGELKEGKDQLAANDARLLLRKNAGEGFAQLTFEGTNRRLYRAKWSIARAFRKPGGKLQLAQRELEDLQTGKVLTKKNEINQLLTEAIGLDFAQFCRTTLLAQGEFTRFLNSRDDEKANILEKITGVDAYTRIGRKVYERTAEHRLAWEGAMLQLKGVMTLTDEEVEERRRLCQEADGRLKGMKRETTALVTARDWRKKDGELKRTRTEAERAFRTVEAQVNDADFGAQEALVKRWNETVEVRLERRNEAREEGRRRAMQEKLQLELARRFDALRGAQQAAERERTEGQQAWAAHAQALEGQRPLLPLFQEAPQLVERLTSLADCRRKRTLAEERRKGALQTVEGVLKPAVERAVEGQREAQRLLEALQLPLHTEEAALEALHLPLRRLERERLQEALVPLNDLENRLEQWVDQTERHRKEERQLLERTEEQARHRLAATALEPKVAAALQERDAKRALLEAQRDTVNKFAQAMRAKLQVGMECPVCRRPLTEALPSEGDIAALFAQQQEAYERAQQTYEGALNERHRLAALVEQEDRRLQVDREAWRQQTERRKTLLLLKKALGAFCGKVEEIQLKANEGIVLNAKNGANAENGAAKLGKDAKAENGAAKPEKLERIVAWMKQERERWEMGETEAKAKTQSKAEALIYESDAEAKAQTETDGLPTIAVDLLQRAIAAARKELQQKLNESGRQLQEGERMQQRVTALRKESDRQQQEVVRASETVRQAELKREQALSKVQAEEALAHSLTETIEGLVNFLHGQFDTWTEAEQALLTPDWNWLNEPEAFAECLQTAALRHQQCVEEQQERERKLNEAKERCQQGSAVLQTLLQRLPDWLHREVPSCPASPRWVDDLHALHASVESTLEQGKAARSQALAHREKVEAFLQAHPELTEADLEALQQLPAADIQRREAQLRAVREEWLQCRALLNAATRDLELHQSLRPDDLEALEQALLNPLLHSDLDERNLENGEIRKEAEIDERNLENGEIRKEAEIDERNLENGEIRKEAEIDGKNLENGEIRKEAEKEEAETRVRRFLEACEQRLKELDDASAAITEQKGAWMQELKLDDANRQRLGQLREEAEKKEKTYQQWSRLNELIGSAKGDKFRKIAQSYILSDLIRVANHYLANLTERYTLKVEPGSFLILLEDAYQGYASRIASTLSGGESFLVSLALALALSDMGQQLKVDTLFIDEGFGTLSGEPLQQAVQTLRSLHSQSGRQVGIISHVEELRERIPVQIRVEQDAGDSSSRVRVREG